MVINLASVVMWVSLFGMAVAIVLGSKLTIMRMHEGKLKTYGGIKRRLLMVSPFLVMYVLWVSTIYIHAGMYAVYAGIAILLVMLIGIGLVVTIRLSQEVTEDVTMQRTLKLYKWTGVLLYIVIGLLFVM